MLVFFGVIFVIGVLMIALHRVQANAPSDSWPTFMIVHPLWAYGLAAIGFVGMACVKMFG